MSSRKEYQICKRGIWDTTVPGISFDNKNIEIIVVDKILESFRKYSVFIYSEWIYQNRLDYVFENQYFVAEKGMMICNARIYIASLRRIFSQ